MESEVKNQQQPAEEGIDIIELLRKFWDKKILILKITLVFFVLGVLVALFSPKQYTAQCVFVPQIGSGTSSASRFAGLAAMAGISLNMNSSDATINPTVYPHLLENMDLQRELMHTKIHFEGYDEPIDLYEYCTDKKYRKFNLIGAIKKYTIGLPGTILGAIKGDDADKPAKALPAQAEGDAPIKAFTVKEERVAEMLGKNISLAVDNKQGYLTLTVNMSEALAATELCNSVYALLKKYVSNYKTVKAESDLQFVEDQCAAAKKDYEEKQSRYAGYVDSHRGTASASAKVEEDRLQADMQLSQQLYSELAKNVLTSRIKVKEETVSFSELSPAQVPNKRTKPKRATTVVIWTFLGVCAGCGWVFLQDWWAENKKRFFTKPATEDPRQE